MCINPIGFPVPYLSGNEVVNFKQSDLNKLEERNLADFFKSNNKLRIEKCNEIQSPTPSKSTDFIHFIWMGNPIKDSDRETILSWKNACPSKQIILWVDKKALEHKNITDFAQANGIILIDLEEIFIDESTFGLSEFIQIEKNRLPSNWGAISDIYRYLIMYYFGGIYSDTDTIKNRYETEFDFNKDMAFQFEPNCCNDRIMTKNIRHPFWLGVFEKIKEGWKDNAKWSKKWITLKRTGPCLLESCREPYKEKIQNLRYKVTINYSWSGKLSDKKIEELAQEEDIIPRIVSNIIIELKERKRLDLEKYDLIRGKIPGLRRNEILKKVEDELTKLDSFQVNNIFANDIQEYEEVLNILQKHSISFEITKTELKISFKKAAKRKNLEIFKYLFNNYPEVLFPISSEMLQLILQFDDSNLFCLILDYAKKNNETILFDQKNTMFKCNDLDLILEFFEKINLWAPDLLEEKEDRLPKSIYSILPDVFILINFDKLDKFESLLNIIPLKMLLEKDNDNNNSLDRAVLNLPEALPIIEKVCKEKKEDFWEELVKASTDVSQERLNWLYSYSTKWASQKIERSNS